MNTCIAEFYRDACCRHTGYWTAQSKIVSTTVRGAPGTIALRARRRGNWGENDVHGRAAPLAHLTAVSVGAREECCMRVGRSEDHRVAAVGHSRRGPRWRRGGGASGYRTLPHLQLRVPVGIDLTDGPVPTRMHLWSCKQQ